MRKLVLICSCFLMLTCNKKQETCEKPKEFEMYQMSEMAALMEQMHVENLRLKQRILNHENVGKFPEYFNKIHTAKMTDSTDNDVFFQSHALKFIEAQKLIYSDSTNAKLHFNESVNTCIRCHKEKCGGPIVKIKKLLID